MRNTLRKKRDREKKIKKKGNFREVEKRRNGKRDGGMGREGRANVFFNILTIL